MVEAGHLSSWYFHAVVKWRRVRNCLSGLRDRGQWYDEKGVMKEKVKDYYKEMFFWRSRSTCQAR